MAPTATASEVNFTILEFAPNPSIVTSPTLRDAIRATGFPWRVRAANSGVEMVLVPPGSFDMGVSPGDSSAGADESPVHNVRLTKPFYVARTEITQGQWSAIMVGNPSLNQGSLSLPVDRVSWNSVQSYCALTGLRLPTEAEWEYACRAGTTTPMYGDLNAIAWWGWTFGNAQAKTHIVATKLANDFGLHDMIGNVWEWCSDWYGPYAAGAATDPEGPSSGSLRVLRGGGYDGYPSVERASMRASQPVGFAEANSGFRVARTAQASDFPDCNGDGFADYAQIMSGELADADGNGVPDCCEDGTTCVSGLVANASFEAGSPLAVCASESIAAPNMLGSAWQVSAGTVDRVRGGASCSASTQPKFGDFCVDLCGTPASSGAIRQIVATIPGHKYRCTFWLSGDASAGPAAKKVRAKVGTYVDLSFTFNCNGSGAQGWVSNQFEFTARGASDVLEFVADNGVTTGGPMLDAINLADITTQCVGDLDASGEVDGADISLLLLNFGPCPTAP